jgi:phenylalanyl-tRNA synthetase alpha chain
MRDQLSEIRVKGLDAFATAETSETLESLRQHYLGKKGVLTEILKGLGKLSPDERRELGQLANKIKQLFLQAIEERKEGLLDKASFLEIRPDLTLPGFDIASGGLHPITQMCYDLNDAFRSLNFEIFSEDEISSELYAFDYHQILHDSQTGKQTTIKRPQFDYHQILHDSQTERLRRA